MSVVVNIMAIGFPEHHSPAKRSKGISTHYPLSELPCTHQYRRLVQTRSLRKLLIRFSIRVNSSTFDENVNIPTAIIAAKRLTGCQSMSMFVNAVDDALILHKSRYWV